MNKKDSDSKNASSENMLSDTETESTKNKPRTRAKKRKRQESDSSTDLEDILPENTLEVETNLHASALKNNLDDVSVKKILKKVVTNDHVLALVKLREEEEYSSTEEKALRPKLTRSKMKELMKASPQSAQWSLELTPIIEIPVKTRPEVTALIAQELQEDEDDEEYKPTHDDVPSDDDHTMESCSDLESQPRTPATPRQHLTSPQVVNDGPFKVPQDVTPARKKLILEEEEATIALRTRSKLSLSETPIEHIESSFVPPDDIPTPVVDDLWSEFLNDCLNPTCQPDVAKNEDDDEADPEYNVAADTDAHDEDEALENSLLKISRKELNDLVTELFNVMPEAADDVLVDDLTNNMLTEQDSEIINLSSQWDGKQEPISDDETGVRRSARINFEKRDSDTRFSIGKSEPDDLNYNDVEERAKENNVPNENNVPTENNVNNKMKLAARKPPPRIKKIASAVTVAMEEKSHGLLPLAPAYEPPPSLQAIQNGKETRLHVRIDQPISLRPEQKQILQQQLRQHVQLAATNFLQLCVNPIHWALAPVYKEYLVQLNKILESNPHSVVDVCNLKPALELVNSWEKSVSEDTPENKKMVEFIQKEVEKCRRRQSQNNVYMGHFPEIFSKTVANSNVFLYPYLLPAVPYRADTSRRFNYRRSEDQLIVLGLDQFWEYVESNPQLFKHPARPHPRHRWGLNATCRLMSKHMFPWLSPRWLLGHIQKARKEKDSVIYKFFETRKVEPMKHKLLPFNPNLTLYEQPEHEMPRIWVKYLAKSSKRFRDFLFRRKDSGMAPLDGVIIDMEEIKEVPQKQPLPICFTKPIVCHRMNLHEKPPLQPLNDKFDLQINDNTTNIAGGNILVVGQDDSGNPTVMGSLIPCTVIPPADEQKTDDKAAVSNVSTSAANDTAVLPVNKITNSVTQGCYTGNITPHISTEMNNGMAAGNVVATVNVLTTRNILEVSPIITGNTTPINVVSVNTTLDNKTDNVVTSVAPTANVAVDEADNNLNTESTTAKVTETNPGQYVVSSNMFRVVETNAGAFLVPFTYVETNTVNSISRPITSIEENISKPTETIDLTSLEDENRISEDLKNHCKCCLILRKICKKQTVITDFFKPKSSQRKCECSDRKYPRITKRLKMLVNNYKSRSYCVHRELQSRLKIVKAEKKDGDDEEESEMEISDNSFDLEDIAAVTSYQLKVTIKTNVIRNTQLKTRIHNIFKNFKPDVGNPLLLTAELDKVFGVELVDLYKEFLPFLTAEQAVKIDKFRDYFVQSCIEGLMKKIDEEVLDKDKRREILSHLNGIMVDRVSTPCELCSGLLASFHGYPKLARHVFSLFPHRAGVKKEERDSSCKQTESINPTSPSPHKELQNNQDKSNIEADSSLPINEPKENPQPLTPRVETTQDQEDADDMELTICDESHVIMDYEADHSSCGDEDSTDKESVIDAPNLETATHIQHNVVIKSEDPHDILDTPELTISKTEVQDYCESTDMSRLAMSDDETVKSEPPEWKRAEDKFILEILMQYLTPRERKDQTILELIEEKNVYQLLAAGLTDKTVDDIRERVLYLLEILVLSEC